MRKPSYRCVGLLLTLMLAFAAPGVAAGIAGSKGSAVQIVEVAANAPRTYGISSSTVNTIRIEDFTPDDSSVTWSVDNTGGIYFFQTSTTQVDWWGNLFLPSGAIVQFVELQACDTTATGQITFGLARMDAAGPGGANVTPIGGTGLAATPGCGFFTVSPSSTLQIDNFNNSYTLFVDWVGDFTNANKVSAVRVFYRLDVSPAPATATFPVDVPTSHPFFRFVEALAAAGITAGTGPGTFSPDAPLTRGQMAVFLSVALGLHFPN